MNLRYTVAAMLMLTSLGRLTPLAHCAEGSAGFVGGPAVEATTTQKARPVIAKSDVVFMYQAPAERYRDYGATVLAWGGTPNPSGLEAARGVKFFGSVGMVTEFSRYYERFPTNYEQGLCRGLDGKPFKVPWLVDHQHKGVPYWWCCTRQPLFRRYIEERVAQTVKAGAYGVHIDDHLGTAGATFVEGGCFCERCAAEFREELKKNPSAAVAQPETYDFPGDLRDWLSKNKGRKYWDHPLWQSWRVYQFRGAAAFMGELRLLAAKEAGKSNVPMSANAGLLWGPHLSDYQALDFFSAEIDHHASGLKMSADPVVAYRIAEAVNRPLASTASGGDWAFIKERNLPGLVQGWIALGYASGHSIMAPNRQWCHTQEKGTHWYEGPKEKFAPFYRFAREHAELLDGHDTYADVTIVYSQKTFDTARHKLMNLCSSLVASNVTWSLVLGGDEIVSCRVDEARMRAARNLVILEPGDFMDADKAVLKRFENGAKVITAEQARSVKPAVLLEGAIKARTFARVKNSSAVIHVVNWSYQPQTDNFEPLPEVSLRVDYAALGLKPEARVRVFAPEGQARAEKQADGRVVLRDAGVWSILELH